MRQNVKLFCNYYNMRLSIHQRGIRMKLHLTCATFCSVKSKPDENLTLLSKVVALGASDSMAIKNSSKCYFKTVVIIMNNFSHNPPTHSFLICQA